MEYKMMIVDDEEIVSSTLSTVFLNQGYKTVIANSGEAAKEIIDKEPLDLLLLDIEMPKVSGLEVLKYAKDKCPEVKIIVLTGYSEYKDKVLALGCDVFISKPVAMNTLTLKVAGLLSKKGYEERKEHSLGMKLYDAPKGKPLADILLIEPIEEIACRISAFLEDPSKCGGYYQTYTVDTKEKALTIQYLLYSALVLIDLQSTQGSLELIRSLQKTKYPPKEFVFYFKPEIPSARNEAEAMDAKYWEGNPFDEKSLTELSQIIKTISVKYGLIKK
ncbi:MAG: response regulator [Candidatus Omnitrophota bacterium]